MFKNRIWQFGLVAVMAFLLGGALVFLTQVKTVVDIKDGAVLYSDGSAEIIVRDWRNNFTDNFGWNTYRAPIKSISTPFIHGQAGGQWTIEGIYLPIQSYEGDSKERTVILFDSKTPDNAEVPECLDSIFYADRVGKTAHTVETDFCIRTTLNDLDFTHWFGFNNTYDGGPYDENSEFKITFATGLYETGEILASTTLLNYYDIGRQIGSYEGGAVANWELNTVVFAAYSMRAGQRGVGQCLTDIYTFNLSDGSVQKIKTPEEFCGYHLVILYENNPGAPANTGRFYAVPVGRFDDTDHDKKVLLEVPQGISI